MKQWLVCCLTDLKNFQDWRTPIEFTLVGLTIVLLEAWVLLKKVQLCSSAFLVLGDNSLQEDLTVTWWEGHLNAPEMQWCKAHTIGSRQPRRVLVFPVSHSVATRLTIYIFFTMKELEYLSEILRGYCLDTYLSVCKRITLDDHYFMWIFTCKVGNLTQNWI